MSRLVRPHIPLAVRAQVALRQLKYIEPLEYIAYHRSIGMSLRTILNELLADLAKNLGADKIELHHRPALLNRPWINEINDYEPPANDPRYLVYLAEDDHDIETRVRGQHGQHSDLGLGRKNKRIARNRDPKRRKSKITSRGFRKGPKRKMQSRRF